MFVSPSYSGSSCSGDTVILFFLAPFHGRQIDINNGWVFVVWPVWLLFCLGITLALAIVLALSSPSRAHDYSVSRRSTIAPPSVRSTTTPVFEGLIRLTWDVFPTWDDKPKQLIFWGNILAFALWLLFLICESQSALGTLSLFNAVCLASEWQRSRNCIFDGEQDFGGFGQVGVHTTLQ